MHPAALAALLAFAPPAPARSPEAPAITYQIQSIDRLLAGYREVTARFGVPGWGESLGQFLTTRLGEKGLAGLDTGRPITACSFIREAGADDTRLLLVPITGKPAARDLVQRLGGELTAAGADTDLFTLAVPGVVQPGVWYARFGESTCYLGSKEDLRNPKALPTAAAITLPNEGSWLAIVTNYERVPKGRRGDLGLAIVNTVQVNNTGGLPLPKSVADWVAGARGYVERTALTQADQALSATQRVQFDPKTTRFAFEYEVLPRPGTELAGEFAALKPTDNRFAGVVTRDGLAGVVGRVPTATPGLRAGAVALVETVRDRQIERVPARYAPLAEELFRGLGRAAQAGRLDFAASLDGPSAGEDYSAALAFSFGEPARLDAELRKLHAGLPAELKARIRLDAAREGVVTVHELDPALIFPENWVKTWGERAVVCVALTETGVMLTVGIDARVRALALAKASATPRRADLLDVRLDGARAAGLARRVGDEGWQRWLALDGAGGARSVLRLSASGGKALAARVELDLTAFPAEVKK